MGFIYIACGIASFFVGVNMVLSTIDALQAERRGMGLDREIILNALAFFAWAAIVIFGGGLLFSAGLERVF